MDNLTKKLISLVGAQNGTELAELSKVASKGFESMSADEKITAMQTLGIMACEDSGDLVEVKVRGKTVLRCYYCDSDAPILKRKRQYCRAKDGKATDGDLLTILEAIHNLNTVIDIRAWILDTLRRITNHSQNPKILDLVNSDLGKWCLLHLISRRRELRIAAG